MLSANYEDWIWFAGLFEGEGCIYFQNVNSVVLTLTSTDKDVIEKCVEVADGKMIKQSPRLAHHKLKYRWRVASSDKVLEVLDWIEPFLGKRRTAKSQGARKRIARIPASRKRALDNLIEGRRKVPRKHPEPCSNCNLKPIKARRRCGACYEYLRRHKEERPSKELQERGS